ncbi:hypothetical protein ACFOG5_00625 [Pedobacter fastidiosus]|uniref:hypothetical protein n=1 Tax=Pedobacter fastidiosus TaxID=2765361 RepID=UPI003622C0FF
MKTNGSVFHCFCSPAVHYMPMKKSACHSHQVYLTLYCGSWLKLNRIKIPNKFNAYDLENPLILKILLKNINE